jgi:hypothetical protein
MDQAAADLLHQCKGLIDAAGGGKNEPWWPKEVFTILFGALLSLIVAWVAIAFDRRKATNQELIRKRIEVFELMAPKLNDLLCFARCVGGWRTLSPGQMLQHKRELDRHFAIYGALFSKALARTYLNLIAGQYFATWQGSGLDARLRVAPDRLKSEWGGNWDPAWDAAFSTPQQTTQPEQIAAAYAALMNQFAVEIGAQPAPLWRPRR